MKQNLDLKNYLNEIKAFEKNYYDTISNFNFNFSKALNLDIEKKKFFSAIADDKIYNPQFKFEKKIFNKTKIEEFRSLKIDLKDDIYGFKKLYKKRLKTKYAEILCHQAWGKVESTKYVKQYRGQPSILLLRKAEKYCKNYSREKVRFKRINYIQVGKILKDYVFLLTKEKISVKYFKNLSSKVNILPTSNIIKINSKYSFRSIDVDRLLAHEIGVHYMRYFNGKNTGIKILESGTSNYIETEEGLAAYVEELQRVSSNAVMYIYAGRVIGTYYALRKSFYEVFKILKSFGFKDEDAFAITYRAKRNICDTSKPGGFTKDYVYFSGYFKIKKWHKTHDIEDLFIGKVRIEDLRLLKGFVKKNKDKIKTIF